MATTTNQSLTPNEMKALGAEWTRERPAILTVYPHGIRTVSLHSGRWGDEKALRCGIPRRTRPLLVHDVATGRTELFYFKVTKTYGEEWERAYPEPDYSREQREKSAARAQARREERQRTRRDERLRADAAKRAAAYGAAAHGAN
jgi:hypothetical protein